MKPNKGIERPAKSSGFKVICWKFQGRNAAEYNSWLTEDRHAFRSDVSLKKKWFEQI